VLTYAPTSLVADITGKTAPLEDDKEVSMFRRILQMREKLEGIIQLQTIKYQRQLALMLRDSKQRQRETELANVLAQGAGAGAVGAPAGNNIDNCAWFSTRRRAYCLTRRYRCRLVHRLIS
jgi:hypothetical protein